MSSKFLSSFKRNVIVIFVNKREGGVKKSQSPINIVGSLCMAPIIVNNVDNLYLQTHLSTLICPMIT